MKAIETKYKGYLFRSRLEARWAVFFDAMGIEWEYEPEGFVLDDGTYYLPDFYLCTLGCYFEVKRKGIKDTEEGKKAIKKIRSGADEDSWAGIIAFGDPMDDDLLIFCQDVTDSSGGGYSGSVTIGIHPRYSIPYLFAYDDPRYRDFYSSLQEGVKIPMCSTEYGDYEYRNFMNERVIRARMRARRARF